MALPDTSRLVAELRRSPFAKAEALIRSLGLGSQASFSRLVARAGDEIVAIGRARARRYAASRDLEGVGRAMPLYRAGLDGTLVAIATLRPIAPGGWYVDDPARLPRWMRGASGNGAFGRLPVFLDDARPAGFLGSAFARSHPEWLLPGDPARWTDDDCVMALARAGDDVPGDLVLGDESARALYARRGTDAAPIAAADRSRAFPALAEAAIAGVTPGPALGGVQPKFGALVGDEGSPSHVLVKFSPAEYSPSARRWCDLIVSEHLALEALRAHGVPAVESEIVEGGSRVFLQATRFDRAGSRGRRSVVSLAAMNDAYVGLPVYAGRWNETVGRLAADRWVSRDTVDAVRALDAFGRFIANTDMHLGNLSFLPRGDGTLELAPVYDMLPMGYAPVAGDLPAREFVAPLPDPGHEDAWSRAGTMALDYWRAVSRDERVSDSFRGIARDNATIVDRALDRLGTSGAAAPGD